MQISAKRLESWADSLAAAGDLPRLVRKLVLSTGVVQEVSVPAGESIRKPGWDGCLEANNGHAWVPGGSSFWEMSTEAKVERKAQSDYAKRTAQVAEEDRRRSTFVFVTPRSWSKKADWLQKKRDAAEWAGVRAFDSDDLSAWLDQAPAIRLSLATDLQLAGNGIESLERRWKHWSEQTAPTLTLESLLRGRSAACQMVIQAANQDKGFVQVIADSTDEATAFVIASLASQRGMDDVSATACVVYGMDGWQYVDRNQGWKTVITTDIECAKNRTPTDPYVIFVPAAAGSVMDADLSRRATMSNERVIRVFRPEQDDMVGALQALGMQEVQARTWCINAGRSWSVLRRQQSQNPSLRVPKWFEKAKEKKTIAAMALMGGIDQLKSSDREFAAAVAGIPFEQIESELQEAAAWDDSPFVHIGSRWKLKSPIELLILVEPSITTALLDRFFAEARRLFETPDPQFDLPGHERYMAAILGKVTPHSDTLRKSVVQGMAWLASRNDQFSSALRSSESRVVDLVGSLFNGADALRWLSLREELPLLAEAAPETFLIAVDQALSKADSPLLALYYESRSEPLFGRHYHPPLLWALEGLSWHPIYFPKAALILARLWPYVIKGLSNSARRSLVNVLIHWHPQTCAPLESRIRVLDEILAALPDIGWQLLRELGLQRHTSVSSTHEATVREWPRRDYGSFPKSEADAMFAAVRARLLKHASGHPQRLLELVERVFSLAPAHKKQLWSELKAVASDSDAALREQLRNSLRDALYRRTFQEEQSAEPEDLIAKELYDSLEPTDLVERNRWLFEREFPQLPEPRAQRKNIKERLFALRKEAVTQIWTKLAGEGLSRLADTVPLPFHVGYAVAQNLSATPAIRDWAICQGRAENFNSWQSWRGFCHGITDDARAILADQVIAQAASGNWSTDRLCRMLGTFPARDQMWNRANALGAEVIAVYWKYAEANSGVDDPDCREAFVRGLLSAGRPQSALLSLQFHLEVSDPLLVRDVLVQLADSKELDAGIPDRYWIASAFKVIAQSGQVAREEVVRLEFLWYPTLEDEGHADLVLFEQIGQQASLFAELIGMAYRSDADPVQSTPDEQVQHRAIRAHSILRDLRQLPGKQPDGTVSAESLGLWVETVRKLCKETGRLSIGDQCIGQLLARSSEADDWPGAAISSVLEASWAEEIRRGFYIGVVNSRGVTSRAMEEGGEQERALVSRYKASADKIRERFPLTASVLDELAHEYERQARWEDATTTWRRESRL